MNKRQSFVKSIQELINSDENIKKAGQIFHELATGKVYIYGAGNAGAMTLNLLQKGNIHVEGFFDRHGGSDTFYCGKPVYKADEHNLHQKSDGEALIIIAFMCGCSELEDIERHLSCCGWESIYYFQTIRYFFDIYDYLSCGNQDGCLDGNVKESEKYKKILEVAALLEDSESFLVYQAFLKAVISGNPAYFSLPSEKPQYFVDDIPLQKGYSRFIDCGAFDGDTAYALKKYIGVADALALFEPDPDNFNRLCSNLRSDRASKEQILFPCGVWKSSQILKFKSGIETSSGISEDGDTFTQCVSIDNVIPDFAPTFIKMDIEGAECEALYGAAETIKRHTPDMAISVYHSLEHLWEIPLLIKSISPGYVFYMRSHGLYGMETILYAVNQAANEL
ncbi:FkbM family methyltransferase [Anaerobacterium chartisolvens]|uniref:FkbM family methyltransferase n=1 Tax=Anaerobacterium chartisolvens TaxID=1297424 RepID=A0A369B8L3_9FIRM|nr:FkbM family methyltransferase [Anaerobacterium chartisolvens]RCX16886.1 FkbM family methyltransferase [Anaerobacterium chartisolvens]